ncbi:hypothetical protein Mgra_00005508 [Meloidogyne graminicola]|uniref:PAS domain-containing protein n=1 Tax=Meloidogyne graminicola TaxID=189291 RepID=A0A8S9ZNH4_9BILA|nr:hypothetical protein Mgra_00005508 [Meloidogyne graminicola]
MDIRLDDPIIKSKHSLDMKINSMDIRLRQILEINENNNNDYLLSNNSSNEINISRYTSRSFYNFIHPSDVKYFSESHEMVIKSCSSGLMIYRLISTKSKNIYYIQTSFRLFFKNSKPDSIGANHRILTEVDGESLLEKRNNNIKSKFLSFDDILLQSPRIFQQTQTINLQQQQQLPIRTELLNNNNLLLFKEKENKNELNNLSSFKNNKIPKITTLNISQQINNKKQKNKNKIIKKLISTNKNNEKSDEEKDFLNNNKTIINYEENLNNLKINNNFTINQQQQQQLENLSTSQNFNNSIITNKNEMLITSKK